MKTKESIVFLSGLLCNETVWEDISKELQNDYEILIISFQGCDSIEMMAKKVLDLAPSSFILIGHSMGGRVALEVFNQASNRVKALGLFNTGVHAKSESEIPERQKLLDLAKKEGIASVAKQWLPPMMENESLKKSALMKRLYKMVNSYSVEEFSKQIHALLNRPNAEIILPIINVPTLLLSATQDKWSPISQHEQMQEYLNHSKLVVIENASHMAPVEQPIAVANEIKNWLNLELKIN
jgi:pimeloyl-ACP methyl ester carboxylesterase